MKIECLLYKLCSLVEKLKIAKRLDERLPNSFKNRQTKLVCLVMVLRSASPNLGTRQNIDSQCYW